MNNAIILDTETTDIDEPEVIQLAYRPVVLDGGTLVAGETVAKMFKPSKPIAFGAMATHHILLDDLEDESPASEAPAMPPTVEYWIGHNIDFDWKALGQPPVKRICTLAMCRYIWPEVDSHSQAAMIYFLLGATPTVREMVEGAHAADVDIGLTTRILEHIMDHEQIDGLKSLYTFSEESRIPRVFSFGKFKGKPISAADKGYANWYARQPDPDPYLLMAFRRARLL